nr:MAG TPA: hypothetical protein [Caudoviricetes sp.]
MKGWREQTFLSLTVFMIADNFVCVKRFFKFFADFFVFFENKCYNY